MTMTTITVSLSGPTVDVSDHLAAAAYVMKRHGPSRLAVVNSRRSGWPEGIITTADLARAAADGMDFERTRVGQLLSPLAEVTLTRDTPLTSGPQGPCLTLVVRLPDGDSARGRAA
jgi:CBS domain-containing protein